LSDREVETSLQLSLHSYAAEMGGLADQGDVRLRFDVPTKTKQPELHGSSSSMPAGSGKLWRGRESHRGR
jgi:hypothetical protein